MRKVFNIMFFSILLLLFLNGCNAHNKEVEYSPFKSSFIGDNSAVGNIVNQLRGGEHLASFELKTNEKPYGITLHYDLLKSEQVYKETVIFNATFIFAFVQNTDWILFNFQGQEYYITKENLQNWYGENLNDFTNEDELKKLTEDYLTDENKVEQLFK